MVAETEALVALAEPVAVRLAAPLTDAEGAFAAPLGPLPTGSYLVEAWFRGGSSLFPSYAATRITG